MSLPLPHAGPEAGEAPGQDPDASLNIRAYPVRRVPVVPSQYYHDSPAQRHFERASSVFLRMCRGGSFALHRVEVIINPDTERRYLQAKTRMIASGEPIQELCMFHCTSDQGLEGITRDGFLIGGQGVDIASGAALGPGVYLSEQPEFAMRYMRRCTGRYCILAFVCQRASDRTQMAPGEDNGPPEHVQIAVADKDRVLPKYVVYFQPRRERDDGRHAASPASLTFAPPFVFGSSTISFGGGLSGAGANPGFSFSPAFGAGLSGQVSSLALQLQPPLKHSGAPLPLPPPLHVPPHRPLPPCYPPAPRSFASVTFPSAPPAARAPAPPPASAAPAPAAPPCHFHRHGTCRAGHACRFSHAR